MEGIRTLAVSIGCTALVCGLLEIFAPKDRFKGVIETVIGLFALVTIVSFFQGFSFDGKIITDKVDEISVSAQTAYDEILAEKSADSLCRCFGEKLDKAGIEYEKITADITVKNNNFTVNGVHIVSSDDEEAIRKIGDELGIATEIERNVPTDE